MKAKLAAAVGASLLSATGIHAQEPQGAVRPYGSIAMVAIRDRLDPRGIGQETARLVWSELRREAKVAVRGEVTTVELITAGVITGIASANQTDHVAVISYADQIDERNQGTVALDVYSVAEPAVVPVLSYAEATLPSPGAPLIVKVLIGKIIELISGGAEIYVVLTLRTRPSQSTFTLGQSTPRHTDARGHATWTGTLPKGLQILRVFNDPGYIEVLKSLSIVPEVPYFKRFIEVTLQKR